MHPRSFASELALSSRLGVVEDHDDCWVLGRPASPRSLRSNALVLAAPPLGTDAGAWLARARQLLPSSPHTCLRWAGSTVPASLRALGFRVSADEVWQWSRSAADAPSIAPDGVSVRLLDPAERDLREALLERVRPQSALDARQHHERQADQQAWAAWSEAGAMWWVGAFVDAELVAVAGVVEVEPALGRILGLGLAEDAAHPAANPALLRAVATQARQQGLDRIVLHADPVGGAREVVRRAGWSRVAVHQCLIRGRPGLGERIRPALPAERAVAAGIHAAAFRGPTEAALVDTLWDEEGNLSLVAEQDDRVVGHVLFTRVQVRGRRVWDALALAPIAVRPERQGDGIGGALVRAGLKACRQAGEEVVFVLGDPAWYGRFGFRPASERGVRCPWEVPPGAFQVWTPPERWLPGPGRVRFHPAFDATV